jgi:hypothetical protein
MAKVDAHVSFNQSHVPPLQELKKLSQFLIANFTYSCYKYM